MDKIYVLFGAGAFCKEVIAFVGKEQIAFIVDNSGEKSGKYIDGIKVFLPDDRKEELKKYTVIIAVSNKFEKEIEDQLIAEGIHNYKKFNTLKYQMIRERINSRPDKLAIYKNAIRWIVDNSVNQEGIICNSGERLSYPEVSGYYIPTLLKWGYRDLAIQYAGWLLRIQKKDGAWYDTYNRAPYVFDSGQILKGLLAIRNILPEVDQSIIKGCEWILSNMQPDGRLTTPDRSAWGGGRVCTELIHLYCLSPLIEAGSLYGRDDFVKKAKRILKYYITNHLEEIKGFYCLSHFYAYIMEALVDLGETELAMECMSGVQKLQNTEGVVPGYKDVHWVCSTGLFQLALVWYKLGNLECGNRAFDYACSLQNESGGWYGSYLVDDGYNETNDYFPAREISWANKYFLDALYYKNKLEFDRDSHLFLDQIDPKDERYIEIKKTVAAYDGGKILDVGCGKGRYLKNLLKDTSDTNLFAVDLSEKVMKYIENPSVTLKQGSLCNIPYEDNYFDVAYTCEALEHAIDIESAIREMARVTRSGGTIVIIDKNIQAYGALEIGEWEQWFDERKLIRELNRYCSSVNVKPITERNGVKGLFYVWKGVIK